MSVIFSRAPLRVSLGGGGTDLPSYYREHGGFLVGGAIDKYVYMLTHTVFQRRYRMKYSQFEEVDDPREIRHPILRESLLRHWNGDPLEMRVGRRRPGRDGARLLRRVHRLLPEGARARTARRDPSGPRSPRTPARSRSTSSASRPASRTSTCRRTAGSARTRSIATGRSTSSRSRSPGGHSSGCATTSCSSTPARRASASAILADQVARTRERRRGDAREPRPDEGDRVSRSRGCSSAATSRSSRG